MHQASSHHEAYEEHEGTQSVVNDPVSAMCARGEMLAGSVAHRA
jgi:hypothetical protein